MKQIKLGILEFGAGQTNLNKMLVNLFDYAIRADELGFSKFWLGEHYLINSLWYNPEILIPIIAGQTKRISVGTAGVLLSYHTAYDVALKYRLLCNLFPGRVDLGIAKGKIPDEVSILLTGAGTKQSGNPHSIKEQINLLFKLFNDNVLTKYGAPLVPPFKSPTPKMWILKTGFDTLGEITDWRANCSVSLFHTGLGMEDLKMGRDKIELFKTEFYHMHGFFPQVNIAVAGICAKDTQTAKRTMYRIKNKMGFEVKNPILGSPTLFFDKFSLYREILGIDEIILLNLAQHTSSRFNCIELLSKVFNLS